MTRDEKRIMEKEFNLLYEQYKESIFKFCMARLNCSIELSEDCMQETFIILFNRLKKGEDFSNPRAFLYRTANNFIMQAHNKMKKTVMGDVPLEDVSPYVSDNRENVESNIDYQELTRMLSDMLNEDEQELFQYRFIDDMRIDEISKAMDMNASTCTTKIYRLRAKIKALLLDYYDDTVPHKNDNQ